MKPVRVGVNDKMQHGYVCRKKGWIHHDDPPGWTMDDGRWTMDDGRSLVFAWGSREVEYRTRPETHDGRQEDDARSREHNDQDAE